MNTSRIKVPKSIILITTFAVILSILRVVVWGKFSFTWILWNIFLAFVPFFISSTLLFLFRENKLSKTIFIVGIILWILFIPNSPYIITDFIHLGETKSVPILFDTLLLFSSALVGLSLFFHSLSHIEQLIRTKCSKKVTSLIIVLIIIIVSFGIYLGRFLRFNSWDIFINHIYLLKNVWNLIFKGSNRVDLFLYTVLFSFSLLFSYKAWKYSSKESKEQDLIL